MSLIADEFDAADADAFEDEITQEIEVPIEQVLLSLHRTEQERHKP